MTLPISFIELADASASASRTILSCEKAGVFSEMRRREFYEKPTSVRKRKAAAARKRELKKIARVAQRTTRKY